MEKETKSETETREIMQAFAQTIAEVLPGYGFILMIFEFNSNGRANYVSNADRAEVLKMMEEFKERTMNAWAKDRYDGEFGQGKKK